MKAFEFSVKIKFYQVRIKSNIHIKFDENEFERATEKTTIFLDKDDLEIIQYDDEEDSVIEFWVEEDGDSDVPKRDRPKKTLKKRKF